jgi:hypothetical protein
VNEKTWLDQVMHSIQYDSFHDLAIFELKLHPDSVNHRGVGEKLQIIASALAFKALDEEDGLNILDGDFRQGIVYGASKLEDVGHLTVPLDQKAIQLFPLLGLDVSLD